MFILNSIKSESHHDSKIQQLRTREYDPFEPASSPDNEQYLSENRRALWNLPYSDIYINSGDGDYFFFEDSEVNFQFTINTTQNIIIDGLRNTSHFIIYPQSSRTITIINFNAQFDFFNLSYCRKTKDYNTLKINTNTYKTAISKYVFTYHTNSSILLTSKLYFAEHYLLIINFPLIILEEFLIFDCQSFIESICFFSNWLFSPFADNNQRIILPIIKPVRTNITQENFDFYSYYRKKKTEPPLSKPLISVSWFRIFYFCIWCIFVFS
jgi:hypothetical protein